MIKYLKMTSLLPMSLALVVLFVLKESECILLCIILVYTYLFKLQETSSNQICLKSAITPNFSP